MRRIRFSAAVSLDGFIAGPNGEHDWIVMDPEIDFMSLMSSFDTLIMGRKTWEAAKGKGGGGMPGLKSFVVSRTLQPGQCRGATLIQDLEPSIRELRTGPGKDIWLFGGGELFSSLLKLGAVDAIELAVIPVLLGKGIPLLPHREQRIPLKLVRHRVYSRTGTVSLEYSI